MLQVNCSGNLAVYGPRIAAISTQQSNGKTKSHFFVWLPWIKYEFEAYFGIPDQKCMADFNFDPPYHKNSLMPDPWCYQKLTLFIFLWPPVLSSSLQPWISVSNRITYSPIWEIIGWQNYEGCQTGQGRRPSSIWQLEEIFPKLASL